MCGHFVVVVSEFLKASSSATSLDDSCQVLLLAYKSVLLMDHWSVLWMGRWTDIEMGQKLDRDLETPLGLDKDVC